MQVCIDGNVAQEPRDIEDVIDLGACACKFVIRGFIRLARLILFPFLDIYLGCKEFVDEMNDA